MNKILKITFIFFLSIFFFSKVSNAQEEKIKIGLLVPISGEFSEIGKSIIRSTLSLQ